MWSQIYYESSDQVGAPTGQRHWKSSVSISYKYIQQCTIQIYPTVNNTNISNSEQIQIYPTGHKYKYIQQCTNTSNSAWMEIQIQMYPTVHKYNIASYANIYNRDKYNTAPEKNESNNAHIQYRFSYKYIQLCIDTIQPQLRIYPTVHKYPRYKYIQQWTNTIEPQIKIYLLVAPVWANKVKDDARANFELVYCTFKLSPLQTVKVQYWMQSGPWVLCLQEIRLAPADICC